jgi:thiol-disulfide isomerase/thioredoxin
MKMAWGWGVLIAAMASCGPTSRHPATGPPGATLPPIQAASAAQVLSKVREPGAKAVVLNVWATWCTPCREEFPDLMRLRRAHGGDLRLVLVSADFEDQVEDARRFLADQGVDFASFLKTGDDMKFIDGLDRRWTGALPATWIYDGRGTLRHFHEGRTTYDALEPLVTAALGAPDSTYKEASP